MTSPCHAFGHLKMTHDSRTGAGRPLPNILEISQHPPEYPNIRWRGTHVLALHNLVQLSTHIRASTNVLSHGISCSSSTINNGSNTQDIDTMVVSIDMLQKWWKCGRFGKRRRRRLSRKYKHTNDHHQTYSFLKCSNAWQACYCGGDRWESFGDTCYGLFGCIQRYVMFSTIILLLSL